MDGISKEQRRELKVKIESANILTVVSFCYDDNEVIIKNPNAADTYFFKFAKRKSDLYTTTVFSPQRAGITSKAVSWEELLIEVQKWINSLRTMR